MRSKVAAVLKAPVRLLAMLGRLLAGAARLLGRPARLLARPLGRFRTLKAPQQIALVVVLAVAAVAAVLLLKPAGGNDDKAVRDTLARFAQATRQKDYQTLCDDLFASAFVEKIRSVGLPCEVALRTGLASRQNPQLTVLAVDIQGDRALARTRSSAVGEKPSEDVLHLVRENGSWRIASTPEGPTGVEP